MKKWTSVLLALVMLAGFCASWSIGTSAAEDLGFTEIALGTPVTVTTNANGDALLAFYPTETGWYVFEGTSPDEDVFLIFTVELHENSIVSEVGISASGVLLNDSGTTVGVMPVGSKNSGMKSLYLEAGKSYSVKVRALTISSVPVVTTFPAAVYAAKSMTGMGNVAVRNIELDGVGAIVRTDELFTAPPPYGVLRVSVQGDAVGTDLIAKKAGVSTLVIYDMAGNEVGRCTATVLKWWQKLPSFLQVLLRWAAFGWIWMK